MNSAPMVAAPKKVSLELNAIFENATVGIVFTRNRKLMQANRLCAEMFGYDLEAFIGQPALILYESPEAYSALGRLAGPELSAGKSFRDEIQLKRKDGSLFWCRVSAKAVNPDSPGQGTLWILEDMSEDRLMLECLERTTLELSAVLDTASAGIAVVRDRIFVRCNRRFEELFDLDAGSLIGKSVRVLYDSDAEFEAVGAEVYADFTAGRVHRRDQRHRRRDGRITWMRVSGSVFDVTRPYSGSVWLAEDFTATREAEERARLAYDEQQIIFDNAAVGILFVRDRTVQRCNRRLAEIFGYAPDELPGRSTRIFYLNEADYQSHGAEIMPVVGGGTYVGELRVRHRDGHAFWVRTTGRRVVGESDGVDLTWIIEDVTERHQAEDALLRAHEELEQRVVERTAELASANTQLQEEVFERMQAEQRIWHVAHHDSLTGLPNRALLHDRLQQALAKAQRGRHRVAVMFLDLDRFKSVNDSLGHAVGDELLKYVAARLASAVRAVDIVSRLGGDEFVIVLEDAGSPDDVVQVAEKIIGALSPEVGYRRSPVAGHAVDRHQHLPGRRARGLCLDEERRYRDVSRQGGGEEQLPVLCPRDERAGDAFLHLGKQAAACHRSRAIAAELPAIDRLASALRVWPRSARALEGSRAGTDPAGGIHPHRRGDRPDRAGRRVGARRGPAAEPPVATAGTANDADLGESVAAPVPRKGFGRQPAPYPCRHRPAGALARTGNHRRHADARYRGDPCAP
jgi:diguanylate cyclase (GGDEF)-like protein/PAS domain S-box-containing protein